MSAWCTIQDRTPGCVCLTACRQEYCLNMRKVWWGMYSARACFRGSSGILLALTLLQLWTVAPLCAEWLLVDRNDKAKVYVDPETISRNGEVVSVWVLDDLQTAQTRGFSTFLSTRARKNTTV